MRTATVIGTGAIGTSIALALTRQGVTVHLHDADRTAARTAEALGAGTLRAPEGPVDLAVLAVPPAHISAVLAGAQQHSLARAYTDVASVKARPHDEIDAADTDQSSYIGGHPLAGTERSGPLAARADLFDGRPWVLTPTGRTDQAVLNRALELVSLCGGIPVIMDAAVHDHAVALTSHAPHLIATLMATRLEHATDTSIRVSGQGIRDVTRIAAGDPGLWTDILEANADAVADVLDAYATDLEHTITTLRALADTAPDVRQQAAADLALILRHGNQGHARVTPKPGGSATRLATVPVTMPNQANSLTELFNAVAETGITIEDIRIQHPPEQPHGLVHLVVQQTAASELTRLLGTVGWTVARTAPSAQPAAPSAKPRPDHTGRQQPVGR